MPLVSWVEESPETALELLAREAAWVRVFGPIKQADGPGLLSQIGAGLQAVPDYLRKVPGYEYAQQALQNPHAQWALAGAGLGGAAGLASGFARDKEDRHPFSSALTGALAGGAAGLGGSLLHEGLHRTQETPPPPTLGKSLEFQHGGHAYDLNPEMPLSEAKRLQELAGHHPTADGGAGSDEMSGWTYGGAAPFGLGDKMYKSVADSHWGVLPTVAGVDTLQHVSRKALAGRPGRYAAKYETGLNHVLDKALGATKPPGKPTTGFAQMPGAASAVPEESSLFPGVAPSSLQELRKMPLPQQRALVDAARQPGGASGWLRGLAQKAHLTARTPQLPADINPSMLSTAANSTLATEGQNAALKALKERAELAGPGPFRNPARYLGWAGAAAAEPLFHQGAQYFHNKNDVASLLHRWATEHPETPTPQPFTPAWH